MEYKYDLIEIIETLNYTVKNGHQRSTTSELL